MSYKACYFMVFGICFFTVCFISAYFFWKYSSDTEGTEPSSPTSTRQTSLMLRGNRKQKQPRSGTSFSKLEDDELTVESEDHAQDDELAKIMKGGTKRFHGSSVSSL